ncbi:MAG TPA: S-methyl-5-thioribose kinase [Steroidobacteraceae bacterium]|nr:S-methyl-5-thioribose kinase [Steroidobacteraceae bacterium]
MTRPAAPTQPLAMTDTRLREAVIFACRELARLGLAIGTSGNVSVRRDTRRFFISPTGMPYDTLEPDDIPLMYIDGGWSGRRAPSSEWRFHRDIFRSRSEVGAIVHTHSPMAASLACTGRGIPAFHYMVAVTGGADIRCAPYHTFGTQELSDAAIAALEGRKACLLANHGVIAVGADLPAALALAREVENLAAQYCAALSIGEVRILDNMEMRRVVEKFRSYGKPESGDPGAGEGAMLSGYRILDPASLAALAADLDDVRALLGGGPQDWQIREVGDGNLNLVFIVEGPEGSVCVKQALPYVRVAGPSWPMSPQRAFFENSYFAAVAPHVGALIPKIHHYESALYCTVMERLSPHIILRQGLIAGRRYPKLARDIGNYVARACFFTSDFARPFERKMDGVALFAANKALLRISVDLIFTEPYIESPRNRHTSPQLDAIAARLRRDAVLKAAAARFGQKFLGEPQALIHGDLHSGSVMVWENDTRVIDPEFAFYGPIGFDLGAFFGNLLLNWYSQPGHASATDDRVVYQQWILQQAKIFWETFRGTFLALWKEDARGDAFPPALFSSAEDLAALESARGAFLDSLFADMLGFGACKMIRRILGFAHVIDFDRIEDAALRADCEAGALAMAHLLLTQPGRFRSIDDVIDAVPGARAGDTPSVSP